MSMRWAASFAVLILLGACSAGLDGANGGLAPVPENIVALAGPGQDVQTARVLPEDGCYWYQHEGPVETILLPLRTVDGRPICTVARQPAS